MNPENKNTSNQVQPITEAPTAKFNQYADEATAIVAADKIQPTVTEYRTAGAERARRFKIGTAIGAGVLAIGSLLHVTSPNNASQQDVPELSTYTVQPGDTLSEVAQKVVDNTPQKDSLQKTAELIRDENGLPETPQLGVGQEISVPESADVDSTQSGVQLEKPAENTELPAPVVPEENGLNPNTPR